MLTDAFDRPDNGSGTGGFDRVRERVNRRKAEFANRYHFSRIFKKYTFNYLAGVTRGAKFLLNT